MVNKQKVLQVLGAIFFNLFLFAHHNLKNTSNLHRFIVSCISKGVWGSEAPLTGFGRAFRKSFAALQFQKTNVRGECT